MRHLIALGLSCCVVGSAAAQTEVIIRRPGQKDEVIRVDSAHASAQARELATKVQGEMLDRRKVELRNRLDARVQQDRGMQDRIKLIQRDLNRNTVRFDTVTTRLALRSENLADVEKSRAAFQRSFADMKLAFRQPHIGVGIDTRPRDSDRYGAYVQSVTPGSPADRAGILSGDIITRVAGKSLTEKTSKDEGDDTTPGLRLISIITKLPAGKAVEVELRRGTQNRSVKVTPVEDDMPTVARVMPEQFSGKLTYALPREMGVEVPRVAEAPTFSVFGNNGGYYYSFGGNGLFADLELAPLNEKLGSYFGTSEGVLVIGTTPERSMLTRSIRLDSSARASGGFGGRGGFVTGRRIDGEQSRAGTAAGGRGRADTNVVYIDGAPVAPTVTRKAAVTLGLEPGDVVVSVDGRKVTTPAQLMRIVSTYERGEEFKLQIMRQKRAETITAKMP